MRWVLFLGIILWATSPGLAHETRPAYLELRERIVSSSASGAQIYAYDVAWRRPVTEGPAAARLLPLRVEYPSDCRRQGEAEISHRPGILSELFVLHCAQSLSGRVIGIAGLEQSITDALVVFIAADGEQQHLRLTPSAARQTLRGGGAGHGAYLKLGITHLLGGADHIAFVLGLLLLVRGWWRLVGVITAFTLAHSCTLALVVLGMLRLPSAAVEVGIALSVLYVALEAARPPAARDAIAERYPMAIAFGFGLLHGGGFAGVLSDIGLPMQSRAMALLLFNLGLEIGQLLLIGVFFAIAFVAQRIQLPSIIHTHWRNGLIVPMGGLASYWLITRSLAIFGF